VSVAEPAMNRTPTPAGEMGWSENGAEPAEPARRWLSQAVRELPERRMASPGTLLHGRPASAISRWAASNGSDLVVLGTRRLEGSRECHIGRTGRELAWSTPCSVLMVRA
jgi:nucleotide-binding universal stress UspA family protein